MATRLCTVLADTHSRLDGLVGVLMRLGSLGRQSIDKLVARKHPGWLMP